MERYPIKPRRRLPQSGRMDPPAQDPAGNALSGTCSAASSAYDCADASSSASTCLTHLSARPAITQNSGDTMAIEKTKNE